MAANDSWDSLPEFTLAEILEMESMFKELGEESLNREVCQGLATSFNCSPNRIGKSAILWQQVHAWFIDKYKSKATLTPMAMKMRIDFSCENIVGDIAQSSRKPRGKSSDVAELSFEARSARDSAWYDVASFLTYRVLYSGELEVRVRFSGFRNTDDEWVNVRRGIRERSIPLEPSECHRVKFGDLVLCFQDREAQSIYFDAHIIEIQRHLHDSRSCSCVFRVRYDHDSTEENVGLERICCRPMQ